MFATYLEKDNNANIFLAPAEQKLFCQIDKVNIYPVPNKWGEKGATTFELNTVAREVVMEALISAYNEIVAAKKENRRSWNSLLALIVLFPLIHVIHLLYKSFDQLLDVTHRLLIGNLIFRIQFYLDEWNQVLSFPVDLRVNYLERVK